MRELSVAEHKMFRVEGHDFLFLVEENAIYQLDPELKALLGSLAKSGELTEDQLLNCLDGSPEEKTQRLRSLLKRRVIVPAGSSGFLADGSARGDGAHPFPVQTLILQVTEACNLACRYCYYAKPDSADNGAKRKRWMSREVAERGIDFLFEHASGVDKVVLVFFGGEPLLNLKRIASAVDYARSKAASAGKHIDFALTTNGTVLKKDVVRFLIEQEIGVTVSMDGFQEVHDRNRRFSDGRPSYGVIVPGLKALLQGTGRRPVVARVTVAETAEFVPQILNHLLGLGFAEVGFAPVTTNDPAYQLDKSKMDGLMAQFRKLSERFLEAARKGELLGFSNLIDLLVVLHQGEVRSRPCGAGLGLFAADPEGRLYTCQRVIGEEAFRMGDIVAGLDRARLESFRREARVGQKTVCMSCWARALCAGGCYYEAWVREGSPFEPNRHYCEWIREWTELGLQVYAKIYLDNPEYLDRLAALRGQASIFNQFYINDRREA